MTTDHPFSEYLDKSCAWEFLSIGDQIFIYPLYILRHEKCISHIEVTKMYF